MRGCGVLATFADTADDQRTVWALELSETCSMVLLWSLSVPVWSSHGKNLINAVDMT